MIILLHGDDVTTSRKELNRTKTGREIRELNGKTVTDTDLIQALESDSLFGGDTLVVIENLFGKLGKKPKLVSSLAAIINSAQADVVLWEDKEVGVTVTKSLSKAKVQLFKTPIALFQFLDGIKPENTKSIIMLFHKTLDTHAPELIFTMIVRRVRQLIQLADGVTPDGLADWQASRLTSQARSFTITRLVEQYRKLLDMEYSIKTGSSPFTLKELLEQYLLDI